MKMTVRDFPVRLQQEGPPSAVLLYGQEQGLAARYAGLLRRAVVDGDEAELDAENFYATDLDLGRFLSACNAFPFLAKRRAVLLKEAEQLTPAALKGVLGYLETPSRTSLLVVLAGPLEARQSLRKRFEEHKSAWCIPCYPLEGRDLLLWIRTRLREEGFTVDEEAVLLLGERLEGDARNAASEIEKLMLFLGERRRVAVDDVLASVGESRVVSGFSLAEAVLGGRTAEALSILDRLLEAGEEPLALLGLLAQRLRRLIQAGRMLERGEDPAAIAAKLQVFWKEKGAFFALARRMSPRQLANGLLRCQEVDRELKSGGDPRRVMERLVMGVARGGRERPASGFASARAAAEPRRFPSP